MTKIYESKNQILKIEADIEIPKGIYKSNSEKLSAIKMTLAAEKAHFIQFVTRQIPDTFEDREKDQWDEVSNYYTTDVDNPRWRLDVT